MKKFKKTDKQLLRDGVRWFLSRKSLNHVEVNLVRLNDPADHGYADHVGPYEFDIAINPKASRTDFTKLRTLFHELTHVEQFATGRLASTEKGWFWMGDNMDHVAYEEQPWEIEANAVESILAELYLEVS